MVGDLFVLRVVLAVVVLGAGLVLIVRSRQVASAMRREAARRYGRTGKLVAIGMSAPLVAIVTGLIAVAICGALLVAE